MPTWIITILQTVLGLIFGPKQADPTAEAEKAGQATQQAADAQAEVKNVQDAQAARESVRSDAARNPGGLRDPDEFSRD